MVILICATNANDGRNPKTGEEIPITARRVVTFKAGQKLRQQVDTYAEPSHNALLPAIPNKRYFIIGEVGELCNVKPHVLRYWEQEFPQLSPVKRRGNRRYYQKDDVLMIRRIRSLLYEQGYTISGARLQLQTETEMALIKPAFTEEVESNPIVESVPSQSMALFAYQAQVSQNMLNIVIKDMIRELEAIVFLLGKRV